MFEDSGLFSWGLHACSEKQPVTPPAKSASPTAVLNEQTVRYTRLGVALYVYVFACACAFETPLIWGVCHGTLQVPSHFEGKLNKLGVTIPTEVQAAAIPQIMEGKNLLLQVSELPISVLKQPLYCHSSGKDPLFHTDIQTKQTTSSRLSERESGHFRIHDGYTRGHTCHRLCSGDVEQRQVTELSIWEG